MISKMGPLGLGPTLLKPSEIRPNISNDFRPVNNFVHNYQSLYNASQIEVFKAVDNMNRKEMLLIPGPPGTGKTQTITGIVAMLLSENYGAQPLKI